MKIFFIASAIFLSVNVHAQKRDTTVQINLTLNQYKGLMYAIDQNIDSKKNSKEITDFIFKAASLVVDSTSKEPKNKVKKEK